MLNEQVIVVRNDSKIKDLRELKGKDIETQVDSSALAVLNDKKELRASLGSLQEMSDYNTAFMDLESGACDGVACDLSIANYNMKAKPEKFRILKPALQKEHYAVAFKKGHDELAKKVDDTLIELYKDGTVSKIAKKYEKYGISMKNWILK